MCGILGDIGPGFTLTSFRQALKQLHHRGPWGDGITMLPGGAMGMTRLPMSSESPVSLPVQIGGIWVAYNGEIYVPGTDIREEISLLLEGAKQRRFPDGMFAFAAWDRQAATITLQRDGYGIKPFYYCYQADRGRLIFASELTPLLTLLGHRKPNIEAIAQIVATGTTLEGQSLFTGVQLLAPGEQLTFALNNNQISLVRRQRLSTDVEPQTESLEEALSQAIQRCRATFRPTALLLSGGVDSTLLNTWLGESTARFTLMLEHACEEVRSQPHLYRVPLLQSDFMSVLRRAVRHLGSASRMSSLLMYQQLADAVGDAGYHCVLLGEGADELFQGYPRHLALAGLNHAPDARTFAQHWFGQYQEKTQLLSAPVAADLNDHIETCAASALEKGLDSAIAHFDLYYSLEPLLRRADHLLMSRTIEARTPYLHAGLGALARRSTCITHNVTKAPLCKLLQQRMPEWHWQPKQHFRLPFSHWPQATDDMRHFLRQTCGDLRTLGVVNLTTAHINALDSAQLFTLTTLSLWQQEYEVVL